MYRGDAAELLAALIEQLPQLLHPPPLRGIVRYRSLQLGDLLPGQPPLRIVAAAAGLGVFVQRVAADGCLGPGDAGIRGAGQQGDVIGMALGLKRRSRAVLVIATSTTMASSTRVATSAIAAAPPRRQSNRWSSPGVMASV